MNRVQIDIDSGSMAEPDVIHFSRLAKKAIEAAGQAAALKFPDDAELSILLSDDERLKELNRQWRDIDKSTNVLSFPGSDVKVGEMADLILGDVVISMETARREAALENKTVDDHFSHLIVHGFLHLFGYDHVTDKDAELMESLEREALEMLGIADPYGSGTEQ